MDPLHLIFWMLIQKRGKSDRDTHFLSATLVDSCVSLSSIYIYKRRALFRGHAGNRCWICSIYAMLLEEQPDSDCTTSHHAQLVGRLYLAGSLQHSTKHNHHVSDACSSTKPHMIAASDMGNVDSPHHKLSSRAVSSASEQHLEPF